ncbi:MAG: hypothetical protein ABS40_04145 [Agrobacterium sp. SCN 61-19]|nr:MAG: hypothetical protein ABS40_04145 [Agrobacterium sp. SCN 61-19]
MSFQALYRSLKRDELPKIQRLSPTRYVLVLSQGVTPANKTKLFDLFSPYILSEKDIIGRQELNDLLKDFPQVETANFKLWFTSTAVMKRVLHNAERCQTEFEVERVTNALPVFVQSNALPRAIDILKDTRVLVVSGVPGIGKTTLADMILFSHLEEGYEPIIIQESMEQARKLFDRDVKQIFYFDDFLGQTFLHDKPDMLDRNQDMALIQFIEAVRRTKHSSFILTTREHILRKALDVSEKLANSSLIQSKCVLQLEDYSYAQKARILYNHLYFGDLPVVYKEELLKDDFFLGIIKHKNFSPRIISWLSGYIRVRQIRVTDYRQHVKSLLDSPETIWRHAFENQISQAARNLLLVLGLQGDFGDVVDLQPAWESLHRYSAAKYNYPMKPHEFRRALQDLEGSFIALHSFGVAFSNPSIRDFMQMVIRQSDTLVEDIVASALRFRHLEELRKLCKDHDTAPIGRVINPNNANYIAAIRATLDRPHMRWEKTKSGMRGYFIDASPERRLSSLVEWAEESRSSAVLSLAHDAFAASQPRFTKALPDINAVINTLEVFDSTTWVAAHDGTGMRRMLLDLVLKNMRYARHYEWSRLLKYAGSCAGWTEADKTAVSKAVTSYCNNWVDEEIADCSSESELKDLSDGLIDLVDTYSLPLDWALRNIDERLSSHETDDSTSYDGQSLSSLSTATTPSPQTSDDEIRGLFSTLLG